MSGLDLVVVVLWLAITLGAGFWFGRRSTETLEGFFAADRSLPWWAVGTSMVATTFAADTPLAVAGLVATGGIAGNWTWWWMGASGIFSVFWFARLWRRSEILTDAELTELRYSGRPAALLRGLKAIWFGLFMNLLTIAWVMSAMRKVTKTVLETDAGSSISDLHVVFGLFLLTVVYTTTAGLYGVIFTDLLQFALAMTCAIALAVLAWSSVGGLDGLTSGLSAHGYDPTQVLSLIPTLGAPDHGFAKFALIMGVIWWANKQVDGGGYLAQRLFAAKDERNATKAHLWFTIAHICVRPWPWIAVALVGMATLPVPTDPELYYPQMMTALLPAGLLGLMIASFLAAFMSTIDTQLNWGASLLVNDVIKRFFLPDASTKTLMVASRISVIAIAALGAASSLYVDSLKGAWELAFSVTAGLGTVYVARWLWWRTNAFSEATAMVFAGVATFALGALKDSQAAAQLGWPAHWSSFPFNATLTVALSLPLWVGITYLTRPTAPEHLQAFFDRVRPPGPGWSPLRTTPEPKGTVSRLIAGTALGLVTVYSALLGIGWLLLGQPLGGLTSLGLTAVSAYGVLRLLPNTSPLED